MTLREPLTRSTPHVPSRAAAVHTVPSPSSSVVFTGAGSGGVAVRRGRGRDDGSVSVELVVAAPLLLVLLLAAVQAGVWWHATHIAESVAAHALAAARVQDGTDDTGRAAGDRALAQLAGQVLTGATVAVTRDPQDARVEVTGTAMTVIPGLALPVRAAASGPTEPPP